MTRQYLRGVITDNGPDDVSVSVDMRYLKPVTGQQRWQWPMDTFGTVTLSFP